jgi:SagB-type dehydrogenase family enzyme
MKKIILFLLIIILISGCGRESSIDEKLVSEEVELPEPMYESDTSIEKAIKVRKSVRSYSDEALTLEEVSQLLWAAQGITHNGKRAAPSAGATYPLELYLVIGDVLNLEKGVYHYFPEKHSIERLSNEDLREKIAKAAYQSWIEKAPMLIIFSAVFERTTKHYGEGNGVRYVHMETGHAAENVYLQAVSLELGTVVVGYFDENEVRALLKLDNKETPLYIMPIGKK